MPLDLRLLATISESEWLGWVTTYARMQGWLVYHTHSSKHSEAGFPDIVCLRDDDQVVVELKSEKGRVTDAQKRWLDAFGRAGVDVFVWRPSHQDEVMRRLRRTPIRVAPGAPQTIDPANGAGNETQAVS